MQSPNYFKSICRTACWAIIITSISPILSAMANDSLAQGIDENAMAKQRQGYQRKQIQLSYQPETIRVDGELSEAVWQNATRVSLDYENQPGEGVKAVVKTEAFLYENGERLFVAIKAYDPNPELIRAAFRDRDRIFADDNVGLIIDTFNDERSGYEFFSNPLGAQADMRMSDVNGWREDDSWDAIWDSAGQITDEGYVVEMSIPFNALRFPETDKALTWNIALWRNYSRDVKRNMSNVPLDRNLSCNLCQFDQFVGFDRVKPSDNLQLTPTFTTLRRDEKPTVPGEWENGDVATDPGLDVRWGVTQDMVLNATINPDFSQVEADASQLDVNNTFSLFFPEKRPFFLDGASYFRTNKFNLVHTRNIASPDYGVKLTGKTDDHSYGLLVANDESTTFLIPGNQGSSLAEVEGNAKIAVARYKKDVGDRNNIGVLMTHRSAKDYKNTVVSVDGNYWFSDFDTIDYQVVRSESETPADIVADYQDDEDVYVRDRQSGNAMAVNYAHQTRDYNIRAGYRSVAKGFRADLGFNGRVDFEKVVIGGRQTWYGEEDDILTRWGYFGDWDKTYDQNGNLLEEEYEIHGNIQGPLQLFSNFGVVHRNRFYDGKYFNENQFMAYGEIKPLGNLQLRTFTRFGSQIDFSNTQIGDVFAIVPTIVWDANRHINLELKHDFTRLNVDAGRLFTANQTDLRIGYKFDMRSILKMVVQYTDIKRNPNLYSYEVDKQSRYFSTQLIYSYKINPQTLMFIGYSDGGYQDDSLSHLERDNRTVFAKFSYAWQM